MQFFLLIALAYGQDRNWWNVCKSAKMRKTKSGHVLPESQVTPDGNRFQGKGVMQVVDGKKRRISVMALTGGFSHGEGSKEDKMAEAYPDMQKDITAMVAAAGIDIKDCDPEDLATLAASEVYNAKPRSALHYRIMGARALTGGKKTGMRVNKEEILANIVRKREEKLAKARADKIAEDAARLADIESKGEPKNRRGSSISENSALCSRVTFGAPSYEVFESEPTVTLHVFRKGKVAEGASIHYETSNGSAMAGEDYIYNAGVLNFAPGETEKEIIIQIIDDNEYEPDENFFVTLRNSKGADAALGRIPVAEVTIINDDDPGHFTFKMSSMASPEAHPTVEVDIVRQNGVDGTVELVWHTREGSARGGINFKPVVAQPLVFLHQETVKTIQVEIINTQCIENDEIFQLEFEIVGHGLETVGADYANFETGSDGARQTKGNVISINLTSDAAAAAVMNAMRGLVADKLR